MFTNPSYCSVLCLSCTSCVDGGGGVGGWGGETEGIGVRDNIMQPSPRGGGGCDCAIITGIDLSVRCCPELPNPPSPPLLSSSPPPSIPPAALPLSLLLSILSPMFVSNQSSGVFPSPPIPNQPQPWLGLTRAIKTPSTHQRWCIWYGCTDTDTGIGYQVDTKLKSVSRQFPPC